MSKQIDELVEKTTRNQLLRKALCSSGTCMAVWCSYNTVFGTCRHSSYNTCEIFKRLEKMQRRMSKSTKFRAVPDIREGIAMSDELLEMFVAALKREFPLEHDKDITRVANSLQSLGWGNVEQAKREERKRIFQEIEKLSHPMNTNMTGISLSKEEWQALKGGE